jgi:hypothetical protein
MKKLFILFLFLSFSSFAQTSYFFDTKGNKTIMRDDTVDIVVRDNRITYALVGKSWEKYITFKDLDYAIIGPHYLKSFILNNLKGKREGKHAYFVIAETKEKKLLSYTVTMVGDRGSLTHYYIAVVDNNDNILDYVSTHEHKIAEIEKITPMMNKHFLDCPEVIAEFNKYKETNSGILGLFDSQKYIKCN